MAKLPDVGALGDRPVARPPQGVVQYGVPDGGAPGQITAAAGRTLQTAGATVASAGDEAWRALKLEEDRLATIQAEDAFTRLRDKQLELTLGEKTGFANVKSGGVVRPDFFSEYAGKFGEAAKAIEGEMGSDRAKEKFRLRAGAAGLQFKENLLQHVMRETDVHARRTLETALNSEVAAVGANPQSDGTMRFSLERVNNMIAREVERQGLTGTEAAEAVKVAQDAARDKMWTARVDALLYTEPVAADAVFRRAVADNQITDPKLRLQLQHKVREASLSVIAGIEAQRTVDEVRNAVPPAAAGTFNVGSAPSAPAGGGAGDMSVPRSVRNNNPGNIEKSGIKWQGQVEGGDSRFVTFATYEDGLRAMQQNLLAYQSKHGLNTVDAIIRRWAPAKENGEESTKNYVSTVARTLGVAPNAPIDLKDPTTMAAMTQAMANVEAGGQAPTGGGGTRRVSQASADPFTQNTNGLPNSRDVAAQLPIMMMRVEKRANELYGVEIGNPDRAAFVARMQNEIKARVSADVQQLNALQKAAQGQLIDAVAGLSTGGQQGGIIPAGGQGGQQPQRITSFSQIQADPKLMQAWQMMDPQAKLGIERLMEHNMRAVDKGDPVLYRDLFNRINQEPGTPGKIDFYQQIIDPRVADRLSMEQITRLRAEIDKSETPGGRSVRQLRSAADKSVEGWFRTNLNTNINFLNQKLTNPSAYIDWTNQWTDAVGKKVDEYAKAGKDPRPLFMAGTPESVIDPKYLQTFMGVTGTPAQGLAAAADQVRAGTAPAVVPPIAQPKDIDSREKLDAWFQTLPPTQTTFTGTDGKVRLIPGRTAAAAGTTTAPAAASEVAPKPAVAMDAQGKLVAPRAAPAEPAMPVLVEKVTQAQKAALRQAAVEEGMDKNFAYFERVLPKILPYILPAGMGLKAFQDLKKAGKTLGGIALETIPDDAEAAARGFRMLARSGTYMRESAPLIRDAIEGGNLTPKELAMAEKMLAAIEGKK